VPRCENKELARGAAGAASRTTRTQARAECKNYAPAAGSARRRSPQRAAAAAAAAASARCLATRRSEQGTARGAAPRYRQGSARGLICPLGLVLAAPLHHRAPRAGGQGTSPVAALARHHHGSSAAPRACQSSAVGAAARIASLSLHAAERLLPLPLHALALRKGCIVWLRARCRHASAPGWTMAAALLRPGCCLRCVCSWHALLSWQASSSATRRGAPGRGPSTVLCRLLRPAALLRKRKARDRSASFDVQRGQPPPKASSRGRRSRACGV
jgi:hypothetical protein